MGTYSSVLFALGGLLWGLLLMHLWHRWRERRAWTVIEELSLEEPPVEEELARLLSTGETTELRVSFLSDGPPYVDTVEIKSPVSYTFQGRVVGRKFGVAAEDGENEERES